MKTATAVLLFLLNAVFLWSQHPETVVITGEVQDVGADMDAWVVKAAIHDFGDQDQRIASEFIENNGTFRLEFELDRPQDFYFFCSKGGYTLYASPGDSLHIQLVATSSEEEIPIVISGTQAKMNTFLIHFN